MTARRQRVLELIVSSSTPVKAYDLFFSLQADFPRITPATVYRSIAWLERHGLVRKIETMHAYVACSRTQKPGQVTFICDRCRRVFEFDDVPLIRALASRARRFGFELHREIVEAHGACMRCRASPELRPR